MNNEQRICPTCKSRGFPTSILGTDHCTFCDGTEGGNPPDLNKEQSSMPDRKIEPCIAKLSKEEAHEVIDGLFGVLVSLQNVDEIIAICAANLENAKGYKRDNILAAVRLWGDLNRQVRNEIAESN